MDDDKLLNNDYFHPTIVLRNGALLGTDRFVFPSRALFLSLDSVLRLSFLSLPRICLVVRSVLLSRILFWSRFALAVLQLIWWCDIVETRFCL
jgi:hypothetical protein